MDNKLTNTGRQSNIELLRAVSMMMIIGLHTLLFGGFLKNTVPEANSFTAWFLEEFCYVSTNCYALISGYFGYRSKTFRPKKLAKLWGTIIFWSLGIYLVLLISGLEKFSFTGLFENATPVIHRRYWFATAYILLFVLRPFLNILIENMSKKQHGILVLLCLGIAAIPATDLLFVKGGYCVLWLMIMYITGAYLSKYNPAFFRSKWLYLLAYAVCSSLGALCKLMFAYISSATGMTDISNTFVLYTSVFVSTASVSLFMFFKELNIKNNIVCKLINTVAGCTFGVYLIHMQPLLSKRIFRDILGLNTHTDSPFMILYFLLSVLSVFTVCTLLELARKTAADGIVKLYRKISVKGVDKV